MGLLVQDEWGIRSALLVYWLLFLIGLPMWYHLTTIERHPLPIQQISKLSKSFGPKQVNDAKVNGYPGYQLSFTIISPDNLSDSEAFARALESAFVPRLSCLSNIAFFKIDVQARPHTDTSEPMFDEERVKSFVDSGKWNLDSSISSLPIINFIVFHGSAKVINKGKAQNCFVYPQWGSVFIGSDHDEAVAIFFEHLLLLLGIEDPGNLLSWYAHETRHCTHKAAASLASLLAILSANPNMPVPSAVSHAVNKAVALLTSNEALGDAEHAYGAARNALDWAESAFFHPAMLARQYFPQEHKVAVYVPLFVPLLMPLLVQTVKALREA